ncbi:hypothetical protein CDD82_1959 [Ophiocordyceps australis]|uniref:Protein kinase C-like n=1 Tax=Ophiocordyceps australis TaxID=1399860 RepID=A0A2C5ZLF0_9HYPO|nr:hypothetical protein CDD82_1959 [Ophiocordyceps australis]
MNDDEAIRNIQSKIEREEALMTAAINMRSLPINEGHRSRIDSELRDSERNIKFFKERLETIKQRKMQQGMGAMSMADPAEGSNPPVPPPKDARAWAEQASYAQGPVQYSQIGQHGDLIPPRHPYAPPGPGSGMPKARPNYTKLDLIKYDTPHLGPRIQLMLSQIQFKLNVEEQYLKGVEKMVQLYGMEGDRKSKADAAARRVESKQKIVLLKQALKRYEDLHIDMEDSTDSQDDDSINTPNMRKPLSGRLIIRVMGVKGVDHAATGRFARGPETFVAVKVEDTVMARTKASRNDRWDNEQHTIDVDKANEVEVTVYDKPGEHPIPIGLLWVRISDIVEEMRRKKIEAEMNFSGWVSADQMGNPSSPPSQFPMGSASGQHAGYGGAAGHQGLPQQQPGQLGGQGPPPQVNVGPIDGWFNLEPTGQIQLQMSFDKQSKDRRQVDVGLGRKGAVRQRKEEVHEMYGHKFVQHQFYNIMRCALCGDFLKYSAGMQCEDCKYTCHNKCYPSVVTKCISKSNAETDPDEEKINHRIPHRFQAFSNMTANWCCHCGYILPFGKKNCRKCSECGLTSHAQCVHLVPDFCGMSMAVANQILEGIRIQKQRQAKASSLTDRTLRPGKPGQASAAHSPSPSYSSSTGPHGAASAEATEAAKAMYSSQTSAPAQRPQPARAPSTPAAAAAAAAAASAAMSGSAGPGHGQRMQSDYRRYSGGHEQATPQQQSHHHQHEDAYGQYAPQPQQRRYNPADYANVNQPYAGQAPPQARPPHHQSQQMPPPQQLQPIPHPKQQHAGIVSHRPEPPVSAASGADSPKQSPLATDPGTGQRIGLDHFNFLAVLGKGNFGKVMLAETKRTRKLYAIKVLKKEFIIENDEVESIRSEKRVFLIANKERHPFLTNLHACFQTETRVYFVMEYVSGGDLMLHIQRGQFGTKRAQFYAAEVCLALKYFHENGVIYRDLKLDNIMLTLDGHIKVADYGLCKEDMWYGSTTSTFCGTPEFMAPEILLDKRYGRAVDWWAFGVLIYQMLLQQSPFRGEDEDEIYEAILSDEPLYPIHMPRDSVSILQKLLTREPEHRLGSGPTDAQEVMSQPFFRNINWDDIYHKRVTPPFKPSIKNATDTSNFDSEFTSVTPVLTPVQSVLSQMMQEEFRGFSYTANFE